MCLLYKILGLARVLIQLQHKITSQCTRVISKTSPYSRQRNSFQSNETFCSFKKRGSSLPSIPEFVVDSHPACWKSTLVGLGMAKINCWPTSRGVTGNGGGLNGLHVRSRHRPRRLSLTKKMRLGYRPGTNLLGQDSEVKCNVCHVLRRLFCCIS